MSRRWTLALVALAGCVGRTPALDDGRISDAGVPTDDAGTTPDGGTTLDDAGPQDAGGLEDAGRPDGGVIDAPDVAEPVPVSVPCASPGVIEGAFSAAASVPGGTWMLPAVGGYSARGVWLGPEGDVWIAGMGGALLRQYDGEWLRAEGLPGVDFTSIDGTSANDIWIGGARGTLMHWDGTAFTVLEPDTCDRINEVHAAGEGTVWAVGDMGWVVRGSAAGTTQVESGTTRDLFSVDGDGAGTVFIVGADGTFLRADEQGLVAIHDPLFESKDLTAVRVFAADSVAIGREGAVLRYDGSAVTMFHLHPFGGTAASLVGDSFDDLWCAFFEGCPFQVTGSFSPCATNTTAPFMDASAGHLVAAGHSGIVFRREATTFSPILAAFEDTVPFPRTISGNGPNNVWVGGAVLAHFDGAGWTRIAGRGALRVHVTSSGEVFALAPRFIDAFDAAGNLLGSATSTANFVDVTGCGDDVYVLYEGGGVSHEVHHENQPLSWPQTAVDALACNHADDLFFLSEGALFRWDGIEVVSVPAPAPLDRLWLSETRLYASAGTTVFKLEDDAWTTLFRPIASGAVFLRDVAPTSDGIVWVAVDNGSGVRNLHRFDGAWSSHSIPGMSEIKDLYYDGAGGLWVTDVETGVVRIDAD